MSDGGDLTAGAYASALAVRSASAQLDDVGDFARRSMPETWAGGAAEAYRARSLTHASATDAMSLVLREAASVIEAYAAQVSAGEDSDAAAAALLASLALLGPGGWRARVGHLDPADDAIARCPRDGSPEQVNRWWRGLSDAEREAVMVAAPGLIGRLNGLPAAIRSLANHVALRRDLAAGSWRRRHGTLTPAQRELLKTSTHTDQALSDLRDRGLPTQLYLYDPPAFDGDGRVAIAAGDLDNAEHIGIYVPGFGHDGGEMPSVSERTGNLVEAAQQASEESVAVLGWLGYDAPDNLAPWGSDRDALSVATPDAANTAGLDLDRLVDGLRAADTGDRVHLTAIGHSYGSTAVGQAAHDHQLAADDLVFVGSPGLGPGVGGAGDLGVGNDHVWVGTNSRDPISDLGDHGWVNPGAVGVGLGNDPAEDTFGANRFQAESVTRAPDDTSLAAVADHSKYFDHDTESLSNLAHIVTGQTGQIELAEPVTDTWRGEPQDPEWDREPTEVPTR